MKKALVLALGFGLLNLLSGCSGANTTPPASSRAVSTGPVQVSGRQLFVNGAPFQVRGVGYQPTPAGKNINQIDVYSAAPLYTRDLTLLRAMHANTIRTWGQVTSHDFLRAAYNNGVDPVYVIMGYWVEPLLNLADTEVRATIIADFRRYVSEYKDEPAVLLWGVGNEVNRAYNGAKRDWYSLLNELARAAHELEGASYHPVATANWDLANLGDADSGAADEQLPDLDVWGVTAYRGSGFEQLFGTVAARTAKPLWIAEFGIDAWDHRAGNEDQIIQAEYDTAMWDEINAHSSINIGGTLMAYSDEWWKAGDPARQNAGGFPWPAFPDRYSDEEYYGAFSIAPQANGPDSLTPRLIVDALKQRWASLPNH